MTFLIETQDLDALRASSELLILHVDSAESYQAAHIPGAVNVTPAELMSGEAPAAGKLPSTERLIALFSRLGLNDTENIKVVVYDCEGGGWAGRMVWTMDVVGYKNYHYLNGGLHAWHSEDRPMETTVNQPVATDSTLGTKLDASVRATIADIVPRIGDQDFAIWDARSRGEHESGRIPGARWLEWFDLMDRNNALRFKDLDTLQNTLNELGLSADKEIVTHCQSHHRSALTYMLGKILGYPNIKGYDGSWSEWGNTPDLPVETA